MAGASKNSRTAVATQKFSCPCGGEVVLKTMVENGKIKIYTGRPFNQKQLEKAKAQASMGKALKKIGADGWVIEVFGTAKPASDPAIASVQDLMGGGEMVKIDE